MTNLKITLVEIPRSLVEALAKKEELNGISTMLKVLIAARSKNNPVFVKRTQSILVMEREQFEELKLAFES